MVLGSRLGRNEAAQLPVLYVFEFVVVFCVFVFSNTSSSKTAKSYIH